MDNLSTLANVVAVTDSTAPTGLIVWWRLEGGLPLARLRAAWEAAGLDAALVPDPPAPATAMHRAIHEQRGPRRLVRPIKNGYAVVDEVEQADGSLSYSEDMRASVDKLGRLAVLPEEHPRAVEVHCQYERYCDELTGGDSGSWLGRLVEHVGAVSLRPSGGIYFVPAPAVEKWNRMVGAVRESSAHRVFAVPALRSAEAVEAISDAMAAEAEQACAKLGEELARGIGKRAMETRITRLNELEGKVASYEALLGAKQAAVTARIEELRANLAAAMLLTESEEA